MENLVLSCLESRVEENRNIYARFLMGPLKKGDAVTVGTGLRRALLSYLDYIAITSFYIQGIRHEFSTIVGVRESVLEIALHLQQVVLREQENSSALKRSLKAPQVGYLQVQGPSVVYANDLKLPLGIECVDPTQYIATLSTDAVLVIKFLIDRVDGVPGQNSNKTYLPTNDVLANQKMTVQRGVVGSVHEVSDKTQDPPKRTHTFISRNLLRAKKLNTAKTQFFLTSPLEQINKTLPRNNETLQRSGETSIRESKALPGAFASSNDYKIGSFKSDLCLRNIIPLNFSLSPVKQVNFTVETDHEAINVYHEHRERILLEIWTNGSIQPRQAIHEAALSLTYTFSCFRNIFELNPYVTEQAFHKRYAANTTDTSHT